MSLAAVRPNDELAWSNLELHLRSVLDLPKGPLSVYQFTSGRANLTYLLEIGGYPLVVRRPPKGTLAPGAHDMQREYRVLSRLNAAYPRAPKAVHFSDDGSIVGAPFVVIEYREGEVLSDSLPASMSGHVDVLRRVDLAVLDAAADLHMVDVDACGLAELGRANGYGERQVSSWTDRWRRAAPDGHLPVMQEIADRLARTIPIPSAVSVVHNDLKLDNCQFDHNDPDTVTSVFDWDMATLGDPLFDLGALLVSMGASPLWVLSTEEAIGRYADRSGIEVAHIDWYLAFATWRTAVVLQQLHNRYASGDSDDERYARFGDHIPIVAERAHALLHA
jgi:aminoglycoside phosphotransferase (APT) family kinase protein